MSTANTNAPASDSILVTLARAAVQQRRYEEADRAYARVLELDPAELEALEYLYSRALARGAASEARRLLASAAQQHPGNIDVQTSYAALLLRSGEQQQSEQCFLALAAAHPTAAIPRLYLGSIAEQRRQPLQALHFYFRAVTLAQMQGHWQDESTTAPELIELVGHAMRCIVQGRGALFSELMVEMRAQFGTEAMQRVEAGLAMYLGDRPTVTSSPAQRPKFFYVPGLRDSPFADLRHFDWIDELHSKTAEIRTECLAVLRAGQGIQPFLELSDPSKQGDYLALRDPKSAWDANFFYRHGKRFDQNHAASPLTSSALARMPLPIIADHAPEVCFSILQPGTHIRPHHGVTNTRLVTHLPLVVPADCALRVADQTHHWREGQVVVFDDTFEHEAWNRSEQVRAVLIADVWHPDLTPEERLAITRLVIGIGAFNQACEAI